MQSNAILLVNNFVYSQSSSIYPLCKQATIRLSSINIQKHKNLDPPFFKKNQHLSSLTHNNLHSLWLNSDIVSLLFFLAHVNFQVLRNCKPINSALCSSVTPKMVSPFSLIVVILFPVSPQESQVRFSFVMKI